MNLDKNPYEAGLGSFIKPNKKTNFIGQESCQRMVTEALKCTLVTMTVTTHGHLDPEGNETVWFDNKVCGCRISQVSHYLDLNICLSGGGKHNLRSLELQLQY